MDTDKDLVTLADGNIILWIDHESSLHLKAVTKFGDPVELNLEEANELCEVLKRLAERLE